MDRDSVAIIAPGGQSYSSSNLDPQLDRTRTQSSGNESCEQDVALASKPLLKLKLLDSLRQGNFRQLQALIKSEFLPVGDPNVEEVRNLVLHYAVQVAPTTLIKEIVRAWANQSEDGITIDINYKDENGDTPLHLSAFQSRGDVIEFLMDQPQVNDCVLNNSHLQPVEMCRNLSIAHMMQSKRAMYVAEIAQEFRTAFNNRDFGHLDSILVNPRNAELLDINGMDPETGDTVLHEFVKKRDVIMCRWLLEHGADPFNRDRQGRLPVDLVGKVNENDSATNTKVAIDIELKKLLGKAAKEQSVIDVTNNLHEPPTYKGYLRKWTNFAQGYKLRWFILSGDGKLSYYKDQADTRNACRGSLNMSTCYLHLDSSEKLKFEIIGGSNGAIRWHLKANHPIETNRWVWAIQGAIRFAKDRELLMRSGAVPPSLAMSRGLNAGGRYDSPLYSSQLQYHQGGGKSNQMLEEELAMSDGSTQQGRMPSSSENRNPRVSTASITSSDLRLNNNLTESGKEYVNRMVGSRIDSSSREGRSRANSNLSHHHTNEKSGHNSLVGGVVGQSGNGNINNQKHQLNETQGDAGLPQQQSQQEEKHYYGHQVDANDQTKKQVPLESTKPTSTAGVPAERTGGAFVSAPMGSTGSHAPSNEDEFENFSDEEEDHQDRNSNFDVDDEDVKTPYGPFSQRLLMLQRSMSMELSSLKELLDTGHPSEEAWVMLRKSLGSISSTFEKLYFLTSSRDKKLGSMLTKQREVNNVWIQSVKDLELELIEKSNRLASLDKERRGLKRLLHKKLSEAGSSPDGSQFDSTRSRQVDDSNATLEGIAKFIEATKEEDEESDAEVFFDAEDLVDASDEDDERVVPSDGENKRKPSGEVNERKPFDSMNQTKPRSTESYNPHHRDHSYEKENEKESKSQNRDTNNDGNNTDQKFSINEPPTTAPPPVPSAQESAISQKVPEQVRPESQYSSPDQTRISSPSNHNHNLLRDTERQDASEGTPKNNENIVQEKEDFKRNQVRASGAPSSNELRQLDTKVPDEKLKKEPSSTGSPVEMARDKSGTPQEPQVLRPQGKRPSKHVGSGAAVGVAGAGAAGGAAAGVSKSEQNEPQKKDIGERNGSTQSSMKKPEDSKAEQQGEGASKDELKNLPVVGETDQQKQKSSVILKEGSFYGYEDGVRRRLKIDEDDRPAISLWSVLKSMVGKDMTRMTLPVTFNEPTSLLQRVAEDLEYSELLDTASTFEDSSLRLLYVSVFTASSYASTIKRVAKPFNPLLGETFEYSRPDKGYRFFTEQVSHHPVISATWTESAKWDFWGESNVDTGFNGRSFNIKHLGLWYIKMRPDHGQPEELYTWKKPNNTVIGILVGNPQVDNNGDVEVVNHTTGDRCLINFRARGWRSQGAYEVTGEVFDKNNNKKWILGGHWNDAIYAKMATPKNRSDIMKTQDTSSTGPKFDGSKFLVWKAAPRPYAPFNLTPFAITLNAPQPSLVPWLAPTDTRLRPDQRQMEDGVYDKAGDEKHRLEQKQRAVRKKRAETGEVYRPVWFHKEIHPVTKSEYWQFNGDYWKLRKDHKLKGVCPDIF
ncbi:hypothetical protein ZYGR_0AF01340 [Zygosaccharomyces rouxii]|uniref:PH domain-containing protein n=1 Tax=Zygosaccharomyces rouxii TaxID=4956 RepID=A0A1Q3A7R8_ZYGRO|nr:hypothetical protein ZYGR_0AF01340 [Zygosaccharomyces rouxii]